MPLPPNPAIPSGLKPWERRLYLVNTAKGIVVYQGILDNPEAVIDKPWPEALAAIAAANRSPVFTGAEIHCHGQPAEMRLTPTVIMDNVEQFGAALGRCLKPNALIEVLACKVASFPVDMIVRSAQDYFVVDKYGNHDAAEEWRLSRQYGDYEKWVENWKHKREAVEKLYGMWFGPRWRDAAALFKPFVKGQYNELAYQMPGVGRQNGPMSWTKEDLPPEMHWDAMFAVADHVEGVLFDKGRNGPRFCKALARTSGATVRAAWVSQEQERFNPDQAAELIGDWEGFVFDYGPEGLKEVHWCLERPVAGQGTWVASALRPVERINTSGRRMEPFVQLA